VNRRSPQIQLIDREPLNWMRPDAEIQAQLPLKEIPVPWQNALPGNAYAKAYRLGECSVIVTREGGKWHLSVAHHNRYPTWDEISQARYRLLPGDIWVAMYLPPKDDYVNVHKNCFQMYECEARKPEIEEV
jgi:hypothetical protein